MENPTLDILLPTYNGERFIRELMDSLLGQTYTNWKLLIRDDGSSDGTLNIVRSYLEKYSHKMIFIQDGQNHVGACQSYAALLMHSQSDYIAFCDQDDVWFPNKIELTLSRMLELDRLHNMPVLVHTDLKVVDGNLRILSDSLWKYQRINPNRKNLNHLLIQNNVTGCATMINRKLKDISIPVPKEAIMYDWWIALVASAFGKIEYIDTPTLFYRQHAGSDTGAKNYSTWFFLSRINRIKETRKSIRKTLIQSRAFLSRFKDVLTPDQHEVTKDFSKLLQMGRFKRLGLILKHNIRKFGILRNLGFYIVALLQGGGDE
jgi:glycosyltransferase involved in cell wall biosynthesis